MKSKCDEIDLNEFIRWNMLSAMNIYICYQKAMKHFYVYFDW